MKFTVTHFIALLLLSQSTHARHRRHSKWKAHVSGSTNRAEGLSLHEHSDLGLCTSPDPLLHRLDKRSYLPPISCTDEHEIEAVEAKVHCQPRPRVVQLPWPNDTSVHQKCRFRLCIAAGMRTENVLDDNQKKQRFRRMIKKQKRQERQEKKRLKTALKKDKEAAAATSGTPNGKLTFPKRKRTRATSSVSTTTTNDDSRPPRSVSALSDASRMSEASHEVKLEPREEVILEEQRQPYWMKYQPVEPLLHPNSFNVSPRHQRPPDNQQFFKPELMQTYHHPRFPNPHLQYPQSSSPYQHFYNGVDMAAKRPRLLHDHYMPFGHPGSSFHPMVNFFHQLGRFSRPQTPVSATKTSPTLISQQQQQLFAARPNILPQLVQSAGDPTNHMEMTHGPNHLEMAHGYSPPMEDVKCRTKVENDDVSEMAMPDVTEPAYNSSHSSAQPPHASNSDLIATPMAPTEASNIVANSYSSGSSTISSDESILDDIAAILSPYINLDTIEDCNKNHCSTATSIQCTNTPWNKSRARKQLQAHLDHVHRSWKATVSCMPADDDFLGKLLCTHLGSFSLTKQALKRHLINLGNTFKQFALKQPEFVSLSVSDQRRLLCRNVPTFIQLFVGRYLTASGPAEQIRSLLIDGRVIDDFAGKSIDQMNLHFLSLFTLNERLKLFGKHCTLSDYLDLMDKFSEQYGLIQDISLLAHVCLFNPHNSSLLDDEDFVYVQCLNSQSLVKFAHESYNGTPRKDIMKLMGTLDSMTQVFEGMIIWDDGHTGYVSPSWSEVDLAYSSEEGHWLQRQLDQFYTAFTSISFGEDLLREILLFSHNVPLSPAFGKSTTAIFMERSKRILTTQPEFRDLNDTEKALLLRQNRFDAVALQVIRLETCQSGMEQIKFACGSLDNSMLDGNLGSIFKGKKSPKVGIMEINGCSGILDMESVNNFLEIAQAVGRNLRNVDYYMLFIFIVLFNPQLMVDSPSGSGSPPKFAGIERLQRRFIRQLIHLKSLESGESHEECIAWMKDTFKKIKDFTNALGMYLAKVEKACMEAAIATETQSSPSSLSS